VLFTIQIVSKQLYGDTCKIVIKTQKTQSKTGNTSFNPACLKLTRLHYFAIKLLHAMWSTESQRFHCCEFGGKNPDCFTAQMPTIFQWSCETI